MKQLKVAFLISAKSGTGRGAAIQDRLSPLLKELGLPSTEYHLQPIATHDVVLQSADMAKKAERLIVVGGDGTAAAAIAGVRAGREAIPVGVIPVGTGNDLGRVTGTHKTLQKQGLKACLQQCLEAEPVPIDIWRINERHVMVNYLSIGMDAAIVDSYSHYRRKRHTPSPAPFINFCIYGFFGLHHIFAAVNGTMTMHINGDGYGETHRLDHLRELVISNIPSYAAGTLLSPRIDYADRYLDVTSFRSIFRFAGLFLIQPFRRLRTLYGATLPHYRGKKIELHLAPGNYLQIDGEDKTHILDNTDTISIEHAGQGLIVKSDQ